MTLGAGILFATFVFTAEAPKPPPPRRREPPEARWRRLEPHRKRHLRNVYNHFKGRTPEKNWAAWRRLRNKRRAQHFERLPSHWRSFLVRHARRAQEHLKKLPQEEQARLRKLPPEARTAAMKEALRPFFREHVNTCRATAKEVFSPLELQLLRHLPPQQRATVLRQSDHDAFGLISPWSWRRYQGLGTRKELVWEYLVSPKALAPMGPPPRTGKASRPEKHGKNATAQRDTRGKDR